MKKVAAQKRFYFFQTNFDFIEGFLQVSHRLFQPSAIAGVTAR